MILNLEERTQPYLETLPRASSSSSSTSLHPIVIQGETTHPARNPLQKRAPIFLIMARASFFPHLFIALTACFNVEPHVLPALFLPQAKIFILGGGPLASLSQNSS